MILDVEECKILLNKKLASPEGSFAIQASCWVLQPAFRLNAATGLFS